MAPHTEWANAPDYSGYRCKTIKRGNCTICIYRPELDEKEQAKREARIKTVAERTLSNYYIRKEKTS